MSPFGSYIRLRLLRRVDEVKIIALYGVPHDYLFVEENGVIEGAYDLDIVNGLSTVTSIAA